MAYEKDINKKPAPKSEKPGPQPPRTSGGKRMGGGFNFYWIYLIIIGILFGVYFFSQAMNEDEAREEADFVIRMLRNYEIDLPVVFDMEDSVDGHPARIVEADRFDRTVAAVTFLHHLHLLL